MVSTNHRRRRVAAVTATVALGILASPAIAYASTPTAPQLTGSVVNSGLGVSGVTVTETVWPESATLDRLKAHQRVPLLTLGTTRTGVDGSYSVPLNLARIPAAYRQGDGALDVQTQTVAGSVSSTYSTVIPSSQLAAVKTGVVNTERFDLTARTVTDSAGFRVDQTKPVAAQALPVAGTLATGMTRISPSVSASPDTVFCNTWSLGRHQTALEYFGEQNGNYGVWGWLEQNNDSSQTVGIVGGVEGEGWSASGSASMTVHSSNGGSTPKHGYASQRKNEVNLYEYITSCVNDRGPDPKPYYSWRATSTYSLDASWRTVSYQYYNYCAPKEAGATAFAGKGYTFNTSYGLTLYGVTVSVSDEYVTDVKDNFQWVDKGEFCGTGSGGPDRSYHVEGDIYG